MANGRSLGGQATTLRQKARSGGCSGCGAPAKSGCTCKPAHVPCGCGQLACLCRPNWFAGQVLTDEDLRRLDRYIIERFRRVNLQFFGAGVVNGLEVRCDPCGGGVIVGCGHAISPCGDDIVVCDDAFVDVCALVRKCRRESRDPCLPHQPPRACLDLEEQWVLAIEYSERPAGGVLPLRPPTAKGACSGDCGGSCSGDCGCDDCGSTAPKPAELPRRPPSSCEPTLLCEDFRFRLCPPPELPPACRTGRGDDNDSDEPERGEMLDRMFCCIDALIRGLPAVPPIDDASGSILQREAEWFRWFCLVKQHILDFLTRYPAANCEAVADLRQLVILRRSDFGSDEAYLAWWRETVELIGLILIELLFACICSGLLPPCPVPATATTVPLATVKVSFAPGGCRVVRVCNWTRLRHYSANLPNLAYWTSFLPFGRDLRRLIECLCCDLLGGLFQDDRPTPTTPGGLPGQPGAIPPVVVAGGGGDGNGAAGPGASAASARIRERLNRRLRPEAVGAEFDRLAAVARQVAGSAGPVEPLDVLADLTGGKAGPSGPFAGIGRRSLGEALILNSLAAPLLRGAAASPSLRDFALAGLPSFAAPDTGATRAEMGALRDEVAALRAEMAELRRDDG